MDVNLILARIDRLEQLILSQARDIDTLRNRIQCIRMTSASVNCIDCNESGQQVGSLGPICCLNGPPTIRPSKSVTIMPNGRITTDQLQAPEPVCRGFIMNPIHPANAIPPVARGITLSCNEFDPAEPSRARNSYHTGYDSAIRTNNASIRNSLQPQTNFDILRSSTDNEEPLEQSARNKSPFSLIELVTCFCPCFNLC